VAEVLAAASPSVDIHDLTRRFGELVAVDYVSAVVAEGEIFGLIGPNCAGKSTLIKMLTTLLPPTSGTATVAGYDIVYQPAEVRRHIGYVRGCCRPTVR
jgi:ABC-2 type transport system ATP-binding protein